MMKDLYIIGAGGFGREVAWLVERINAISIKFWETVIILQVLVKFMQSVPSEQQR